MKENEEPRKERIGTRSLRDLAIYLAGLKDGKGDSYPFDLRPLGLYELGNLWDAIKYLEGDNRFIAERDEMVEESRTDGFLERNAIYNENSKNPKLILDGCKCRKLNGEEYRYLIGKLAEISGRLGVDYSYHNLYVDTKE